MVRAIVYTQGDEGKVKLDISRAADARMRLILGI